MSKSNNNNKEKERSLNTDLNFMEHKIIETKAKNIIDFILHKINTFLRKKNHVEWHERYFWFLCVFLYN